MVELGVDFAHNGLFAGRDRLIKREPADATIFVGLIMNFSRIVGFEEETTVEMEVGGDEMAALLVEANWDDFEREDFGGEDFE